MFLVWLRGSRKVFEANDTQTCRLLDVFFMSANMLSLTCVLYDGGIRFPFLSKTPGFRASLCALTGGSFEIGSAMFICFV